MSEIENFRACSKREYFFFELSEHPQSPLFLHRQKNNPHLRLAGGERNWKTLDGV